MPPRLKRSAAPTSPAESSSSSSNPRPSKRVTRLDTKISAATLKTGMLGDLSGGVRTTPQNGWQTGDGGCRRGYSPFSNIAESLELDAVMIPTKGDPPSPIYISSSSLALPSPALSAAPPSVSTREGRKGWKADVEDCKAVWGKNGEVEGWVGMVGVVHGLKLGEVDDSVVFTLSYDDIEGHGVNLSLEMVFQDLSTYPSSYDLLLFGHNRLPKRAGTSFSRFTLNYDLPLANLIATVLASLQGDDEASGGKPSSTGGKRKPVESEDEGNDDDMEEDMDFDLDAGFVDHPGRGFEVAAGSPGDLGRYWGELKEHFAQGESFGYRPGFTRVSDFIVISYSIPLKNLPIDPNTLAIWDDGLLSAWKDNQRLCLMMDVGRYPPQLDKMRHWLRLEKDYKPSQEDATQTTRGQKQHFYLSAPLASHLKFFPRMYKLRTGFGLSWDTCERVGLDEDLSQKAFQKGVVPEETAKKVEEIDPIEKGWEGNLPLCATWWMVRRFLRAREYCLNCGLPVEIPSLRPYVCEKPLCLYGFMSLGLGPSIEHVIQTQPAVVDLLLNFAHAAASSRTRMELPLGLHIEVPVEAGVETATLLDELPAAPAVLGRSVAAMNNVIAYTSDSSPLDPLNQRKALVWLIESLPNVSQMKQLLDSGNPLKDIEAFPGAMGVLRWVVGSCKAYLKETKPNEGVLNSMTDGQAYGNATQKVKQFTFVVGSPQQERDFKAEIEVAQKSYPKCLDYPTMLAWHGSAGERWHNILRTGLDYQEIANARAYGNGVYFANEASISIGSYSRGSGIRPNADFLASKAAALVELVNVPETFVSSNRYYVVGNIKQIKPFLLLVFGVGEPEVPEPVKGKLFIHDPSLKLPTTFYNKPLQLKMPDKIEARKMNDKAPNHPEDVEILSYMPTIPPKLFEPSPAARLKRLQIAPPPTDSSVTASKVLGKEFKGLIKQQGEGRLPFYIHPDNDSLYCWLLELWDFPDSTLKDDMKKYGVRSIIAEMRFPASFPSAPPFLRILHPRCMQFMHGGGGHVTGGGSICHEILTGSGWNIAYCVEAVIRDVMINLTESTPPARLDPQRWDQGYSFQEAMDAFKRVARDHGWQVPMDFDRLRY
ncbi:ubiquitin-conjugating enzyme E2 Q, partial [Tremellales sp. Uapishka_1]